MLSTTKFPFYAKVALVLIGSYVLFSILYLSQRIVVPFVYAAIISIVLNPIVNFLEKKKVNRILAITLAVLTSLVATAAIFYLIISQFSVVESKFTVMGDKFTQLYNQATAWISLKLHIDPAKIGAWTVKTKATLLSSANQIIGQTLLTISGLLIVVFLIPVYIFMMLYYKPLLLQFVRKLFSKINQDKLNEVLGQVKGIIQSYLIGLLIEALIIATLNSTALLILGIDSAILLGIIGALLNAIPFIGGIISVAIPMVVALLTKDSPSYGLLVLLLYALIQFVDNHYITPKVVASKVKINALTAVFVVLVGDALWGIPGMCIAIPVTGIIKVICEYIEELRPWAILLGDDMPISGKIFMYKRKKKNGNAATLHKQTNKPKISISNKNDQ
jgi:predicted PurR-regulated permease PerM